MFTDSEGTLESISTTKQIEKKSLCMVIQDLKERMMDREISSYQWIPTCSMWADALAKEMDTHEDIKEVLMEGNFEYLTLFTLKYSI